ncbi:MAG: hypothetical protein QW429_04705 [Thermoprotei archaeon]
MLYDRLEYFGRKYPTKAGFLDMLVSRCSSTRFDQILRTELVRLPVSPNNFLGLGLRLVRPTHSDSGCTLFVTLHTAHPKNRLNLKHVSYIDEVYALALSALNMKHPAFKTFFEKHFGPTLYGGPHHPRIIDQLSMGTLSVISKEEG